MGIHRGQAVMVGRFTLYAAGAMRLIQSDIDSIAPDVVIDLAAHRRFNPSLTFLPTTQLVVNHLEDFGGVPDDWHMFIDSAIRHLDERRTMLAFCRGGHGRTGCFLSSLVAILEPDVEDPIEAIRERYCQGAVESLAQACAVFALRNQPLPVKYRSLL